MTTKWRLFVTNFITLINIMSSHVYVWYSFFGRLSVEHHSNNNDMWTKRAMAIDLTSSRYSNWLTKYENDSWIWLSYIGFFSLFNIILCCCFVHENRSNFHLQVEFQFDSILLFNDRKTLKEVMTYKRIIDCIGSSWAKKNDSIHARREEGDGKVSYVKHTLERKTKSQPGIVKELKNFFASSNFDGVCFHLTVSFIFNMRHVWHFIVFFFSRSHFLPLWFSLVLSSLVVLNLVKQSNFVRMKKKKIRKGWRPARR